MVEDFIRTNGSPDTPHPKPNNVVKPVRKTTPARSAKKQKGRQLPMNTTTLPVPKNGHTYGIGEAVGIAIQSPKNSRTRGALVSKMLEMKYVRADQATLRRKINEHEKDDVQFSFNAPWNFIGRRPLLTDEECAECAAILMSEAGEKTPKSQINDFLVEKLKKNGHIPETGMSYNDNTLNNYFAHFAMRAGLSLEKSSNTRTNNRWIAEHSIINEMSYIIVIEEVF